MTHTNSLFLGLFACGLALSAGACDRDNSDGPGRTASVDLTMSDGSAVPGDVLLVERGDHVTITAELRNLPPGKHGFHIHEVGQCDAPAFQSAGGHFAPEGAPHGAPSDDEHHAGDLGNIEAGDDGVAHIDIENRAITLDENDASSVIGRALVIHAGADDMKSQPSGAAGDRLACGVIELVPARP